MIILSNDKGITLPNNNTNRTLYIYIYIYIYIFIYREYKGVKDASY